MKPIVLVTLCVYAVAGCGSAEDPSPAADAGGDARSGSALAEIDLFDGVCEETIRDVAVTGARWPEDCRDIVYCPIRACTGCIRWRDDSWDAGRYSTELAEPRRCW